MKTQSVALVARILVKTQPFRTTGEKGSMKTRALCISSKNPCKNTAYSHDRWKRLYENTERCISSKNPCENTAYSHDRWKRLYENTERCISSKNPCKNTTMSQASQKGAGKTQHFLQLVHCWEVLWDPRSMSMSKKVAKCHGTFGWHVVM